MGAAVTFDLDVNGFSQRASYDAGDVDEVLLPLARRIAAVGEGVVLLSGPPGSGKSTLALVLAALACEAGGSVQALGMDGFHLSNARLDALGLRGRKGAPETFDLPRLERALSAAASGAAGLTWPVYSRALHDVLPQEEPVAAPVRLVEGNYLLLDRPHWRDLREHAALTIFLGAPEPLVRERLVARKVRGGLSPEQARAFYERSDGRNVALVLGASLPADVALAVDKNGRVTALA